MNLWSWIKKVYSHDLIMEKALDFIDENSDKPFFLYLTPTIPHADLIVPNNELFDYDGKFEEVPFPGQGYTAQPKPRATFAAMVTRLDRDVQRVMDLLGKKGIMDNTIIIFIPIKRVVMIQDISTITDLSVELNVTFTKVVYALRLL